MFPLTRPFRQVLATIALLTLTVLPTLYVVSTACRIRTPGHLREVEVEISRRIGLHVSLESVRYPKPGEVVYGGVVFRQEEPRNKGLTEIARAKIIRLQCADRELMLETEGLRVRGESPKLAMAQVGALLQRPIDESCERVTLAAPTCELDLGHDGLRYDLREVAGTFQIDRTAPSVKVSYRLASNRSNTRCELVLTRDRKADPVGTSLVMKTVEGLPLPARVLDCFFDAAEWLGPDARVDGALTLRQAGAKEWEAEFQGDLIDVDLATLVGRRFPSQRLSGLARLAIRSARWGERPGQGFGWVDARGEMTTGQGSIGTDMLRALESEMNFRISDRIKRETSRKNEIDFRALGLTFAMTQGGEIHVSGALGNEFAPNVVLANPRDPIAYAPRGAANVRGLIKTLFPANAADPGVLVPLTAESRILLCLPAPPNGAARTIEGN